MKKQKSAYSVSTWLLVVMLLVSGVAFAQQNPVSGIVKDPNGAPLPGVNVVVAGTQNGTITDADGRYTIQASGKDKLTFSFIGMLTSTEVVNGRSVIHVTLKEDAILLDNVVVTALGIKREEKALGYAVQKIDGSELQHVKGLNVGTSLSGKVAGLKVTNPSDFAQAPALSIRGENPIIVVDGVPYANLRLSDIAADDIDNLSVLKGATASALYGERGQGGAVMITTKKGSEKKGFNVSVNSNTLFTAGHLAIPETQSVFGRGTTGVYNPTADRVWGQEMDGTPLEQWNPVTKTVETMPYLPVGKNNFRNFLRPGYVTNNNISVSQSGSAGNLRASANWTQNKGEYPNSRIDKYSFSLGGDLKYRKFTLSSTLSYSKHESPNAGFNGYKNYDPMYSLLIWSGADYDIRQYRDYWVIKDEFQNNPYNTYNKGILTANGSLDNPYFQQYERTRSLNRDIFNGMFNAGYEIRPWLNANFRVGLDYYTDGQEVKIAQGNLTGSGEDYGWSPTKVGHYADRQASGYSINSDFILTASKTFNRFTVEGFAGGTLYYIKDKTLQGSTVDGLSIPGFFSLKASNKTPTATSLHSAQQVNSLYARIGASWNDLVYIESTWRNDWNSTLPEGNRSYLYPSVAGSFVLSELLPRYDRLSIWKVRGSWTVSKKAPGIYENNTAYSVVTNVWGDAPSASLPSTIKNAGIAPETASTFEIGTMASLFGNRLSVDAAYYNKRLYNRIINASVSPASGYKQKWINIDEEISTRGFELTLRGTPLKTADMQLDITTNWTRYARYYTRIDEEFSADKPWIKKGERYDALITRDFQRHPGTGEIIHNNGVPLYSNYDSVFGYADPDWIWGAGLDFRYKAFTLSLSFDGRIGGYTPSITEAYLWLAGSHPGSVTPERLRDSREAVAGNSAYAGSYIGKGVQVISGEATYDTYGNILTDTRVFAPNDVPVTYKRYIDGTHKNFIWGGTASPLDIHSTTFFKLREFSLTYELPETWLRKIRLKDASVSFVGQNVLLWAKAFKFSDPDGGTENLNDPSPRYLGFNLKFNF